MENYNGYDWLIIGKNLVLFLFIAFLSIKIFWI